MAVNSLPKTVTRQRRGCDLNPGPSAPESSTLTVRLPSGTAQKNRKKYKSKHYRLRRSEFLTLDKSVARVIVLCFDAVRWV